MTNPLNSNTKNISQKEKSRSVPRDANTIKKNIIDKKNQTRNKTNN
jgi:hypothetical protein